MACSLLDCGICLAPFDNPYIIPVCGHTFCFKCVQAIPKTQVVMSARIHDEPSSACPVCSKRFQPCQVQPNFALRHVITECDSLASLGDTYSHSVDLLQASRVPIYCEAGVPPRFAELLAEEDQSIALRVYILDNSGSMKTADGQIVSGDGSVRWTTRWNELKRMAKKHAEWNANLRIPSEFVLLNSPSSSNLVDGTDLVRVDEQKGSTRNQIRDLTTLLDRTKPKEGTPLTQRVHDLTLRFRYILPELRHKGKTIMLILVTDGVPNGSRDAFAEAIRGLLQEHPVHIVVRLCSREDCVVSFFRQVNQELELSLHILNDFEREAKLIRDFNPWFTYREILHTVREAGTLSKLMDFVDERPLTPMEAGLFVQLLLRGETRPKYPWQPDDLLKLVQGDIAAAPLSFCIIRRGFFPFVDMSAFLAVVHPDKYSLIGRMANAIGLGGVAEAWYEGHGLIDALQHANVTPIASTTEPSFKCGICSWRTDGAYEHCCRTCRRSGGKEHGPSCRRRNGPPPVETRRHEILKLGAVPQSICFLCSRGTDGRYPHCCRTCERSGGTKHGPKCEIRFALKGYPQARSSERESVKRTTAQNAMQTTRINLDQCRNGVFEEVSKL